MDLHAVNAFLERIRLAKTAELKPCSLVTSRFIQTPPHAVGIAHLMLRPRMLLGDPTGSGKTPEALVSYAYLKEKAPKLKMLVCTTQTAQFQWARAVDKFLIGVSARVVSYERTKHGTFEQLGLAGRNQQWPALMGTDIWITTYALMVKENLNMLMGLDQFVFVMDEAQTLKSFKGEVQYPAAQRVTQKARAAWSLSATPMMNDRLDELYSVMELTRPGTFGEYSAYRKTYYKLRLIKPKWKGTNGKQARAFYKVEGYQNLELLRSQIDPFFLKRPIAEFQQYLPPVTFQQLEVPLSSAQRHIYEEIVSKHWPGSRTPIQQLASLTYAQMAVDAPEVLGFPSVPSAKLAELLRLLGDSLSDQQVLVYAKFEKVVQYLSAALKEAGIPHGIIAGPVSPAQRLKAQDAFQAGKLPVMLITSAGAQALDLQAASTVICYNQPWAWGELQQIVGRARRVGSAHANVGVILLCGEKTIDIKVAKRLVAKETTIGEILGSDPAASLKGRMRIKADASVVVADTDEVYLPEDDLSDLFKEVRATAV